VAVALAGGVARLSVTLEPAELGRVEISLERRGETAELRILAERPETLALLQREQRELDRALNQAGLAPEARALSFALAGSGSGGSGPRREGRGGGERPAPLAAQGAGRAEAAAAPPPRRLLSLLDLAV